MPESLLGILTVVVVAGALAQWFAWRLGLPSILLLLAFGFIVGPLTGLVDADRLMGDLLFPFVSLSVALILYEGGLSLQTRELRDVGGVFRNLVSVGALVTWCVCAAAGRFVLGLDISTAVLLGAVLIVTGPTVIIPLLRHIRPSGHVGSILKWEGIVIDPIGALAAVLVFEFIVLGEEHGVASVVLSGIVKTIVGGAGLGFAAGILLALLLKWFWVPDFLQNSLSLMLVVAVFAVSNAFQEESGLLAVTVMGIVLANQRIADVRHIVEFKENLRVLLISALFILLAARLDPVDLRAVAVRGGIFVAVLILVARPLAVLLSTARSKLRRNERLFLAWMAPRGIVAAAVMSVFALRLDEAGHPDADVLVPITFLTIIGTVGIYGLTAPYVARRLGVADPDPQGLLIVGAHPWIQAVADVLVAKGIRVLLVDSNRGHTSAARMAGHRTYTGSILAEYTLDEIELGGIGRLLALTPNDWVNVLAVQRLRGVFGRANCHQLPPAAGQTEKKPAHGHLYGRLLFGGDVTFHMLEARFAAGAVVKATRMTESFGFDEFNSMYGESAVPMFLVSDEGKLTALSTDETRSVPPDHSLISLVFEKNEDAGARNASG